MAGRKILIHLNAHQTAKEGKRQGMEKIIIHRGGGKGVEKILLPTDGRRPGGAESFSQKGSQGRKFLCSGGGGQRHAAVSAVGTGHGNTHGRNQDRLLRSGKVCGNRCVLLQGLEKVGEVPVIKLCPGKKDHSGKGEQRDDDVLPEIPAGAVGFVHGCSPFRKNGYTGVVP
jgi:hypothetical protein